MATAARGGRAAQRRQARLARLAKHKRRAQARGPLLPAEQVAVDPLARAERKDRGFLTEFPIYLGAAAIIVSIAPAANTRSSFQAPRLTLRGKHSAALAARMHSGGMMGMR